ncbi:MAG: FmdB family zinc ribbon protein [Candidatus Aminicenantales bacterium]
MPIYEFICRQCGQRFECLTRIGNEKEVTCPSCGSAELTKLFSSFGISGGSSRVSSDSGSGCSSCFSRSCSTCR